VDKADELGKLYQEILQCSCCQPKVFPSRVPRQVLENTLNSEIVLMAQAPGACGVRISGVHWNKEDGSLTRGGSFLDKKLTIINYSVNFHNEKNPRPYTTNVLQCWTGRTGDKKRDRNPTKSELEICKKWWQKELEIIQPKIMVLLGAKATESLAQVIEKEWFFAKMLKCQEEHIEINDIELLVYFLPHPAAPFKESNDPYRTKSQIYYEVFSQVKEKMRI
jgi:uracil-DNA glycosylase family 4